MILNLYNSNLPNCRILTSITNSAEICFKCIWHKLCFHKVVQKPPSIQNFQLRLIKSLQKNSLKGKTFWKKRWPSRRKNRPKQIDFSKLSRVPFVAVGVYCFCPWRYCLEEAISLLASLIALMLHCSGDTQMMMKRHKNCQRLLWGHNVNVIG